MASEGYANPAALVTTEWVAQHLNDPKVRLIEVDVDTTAYDQGHIPGAVGVNWSTQLTDQIQRDIPKKEAWERLMSQCGVTPDTKIVFYGDNNNWFAAYAYWVAKMYGHEDVVLMNGGRKKWELEGRPMTTERPNIQPTQYKAKDLDPKYRAYMRDVLPFVGAPAGKALVDVRSPAEYNGEIIAPPGLPETAQRCGHIPGAVNIPWGLAVNEDGTFKSPEELRQLYASKGVTPDKEVIAYCRIGERSSHTWFVLKELLGYPHVRNYDGSWTEWGSVIGVPIENPAASKA
ncbi:MAG TPA: sulfurtransferase [Chloroflexota bacterium]|jgi:thiosulfate/3-mercaptopyruvate sulfurtransferase|nr:sulfurtransferase [Chloroflexota bacterium]